MSKPAQENREKNQGNRGEESGGVFMYRRVVSTFIKRQATKAVSVFIFKSLVPLTIIGILLASAAVPAVPHLDNEWRCEPAPNPAMTYILRPNSDFSTLGVAFRTNELGFRDRPIFEKGPGVFRILCLGDSITFGTGVKNEQTYPNVLEGLIQRISKPGVTVDVINAGISAYNIRNIRGLLQEYIQSLKPDVVVYTFVENDLDDSVSAGADGWLIAYDPAKSPDEPFIGDDFPAIWVMHWEDQRKKRFWGKIASLFDNRLNIVSETPPPLLIGSHPETVRRWKHFEDELRKMKTLCESNGSPLLVYSFGLKHSSEAVVRRLVSVCQRVGLPHASTLPIFDKADYMRKYSLGYDPHCNPTGHQLMADRLFSYLSEQGVLNNGLLNAPTNYTRYKEELDPAITNRLEQEALKAPSVIDIKNAKGALGLIGGIDVEGKMARWCLFRLSGPGNRIRVTVSGLFASPEKPQTISAEIEDIPVGKPVLISR